MVRRVLVDKAEVVEKAERREKMELRVRRVKMELVERRVNQGQVEPMAVAVPMVLAVRRVLRAPLVHLEIREQVVHLVRMVVVGLMARVEPMAVRVLREKAVRRERMVVREQMVVAVQVPKVVQVELRAKTERRG